VEKTRSEDNLLAAYMHPVRLKIKLRKFRFFFVRWMRRIGQVSAGGVEFGKPGGELASKLVAWSSGCRWSPVV
jgi:hypothetical protein